MADDRSLLEHISWSPPAGRAVRATRKEWLIRVVTGRYPQSFVDRRLAAADRDAAEIRAGFDAWLERKTL